MHQSFRDGFEKSAMSLKGVADVAGKPVIKGVNKIKQPQPKPTTTKSPWGNDLKTMGDRNSVA